MRCSFSYILAITVTVWMIPLTSSAQVACEGIHKPKYIEYTTETVDNEELQKYREHLLVDQGPEKISIVSKYIQETGATAKRMRLPLVRGGNELGPEKLIVSISLSSLEAFLKNFGQLNFLSFVGHANTLFKGNVYSFGGNKSPFRMPSENTPLPMLILSESEALRASRFLELAGSGRYPSWSNMLKQPWRIPGYLSKESAYTCCTRWTGDLPIGDILVDHYTFPDNTNEAAKARIAEINSYPKENIPEEIAQVWTAPGHMQLSTLIGQREANVKGEFASPGWVIQTLLGPTSEKRVPIIFLVRADHKAEIPDALILNFEQPW